MVKRLQENVGVYLTVEPRANSGFPWPAEVFNYIGGALIYTRSQYADRVKLLSSSWVEANRDRDKSKQKETLGSSWIWVGVHG